MSEYDLELERIAKEIRKGKAKTVCIQLPDGLKPKAQEISGFIEKNTDAKCFIWLGSCFGACDLPQGLEKLNVDTIIQFGHTEWKGKK